VKRGSVKRGSVKRGLAVLALWLFSAAVLTACADYSADLRQRLAGLTPAQRQAVLATECARQIRLDLPPASPERLEHARAMRAICEEMTGRKIFIDDAPPPRGGTE
jgi:hypothetical protein